MKLSRRSVHLSDTNHDRDPAPVEDLDDLYENAPCGYLSLRPDARIVKANRTLATWTEYQPAELPGKLITDLLNMAGRIFFETHVRPLLRMQGFFNEFAIDMVTKSGSRVPVLANAVERRDEAGGLLFTRVTIFRATDRRRFERELLDARAAADAARQQSEQLRLLTEANLKTEREAAELREQFIAVLGHDLRNPLASLSAGARMMLKARSPEEAIKFEAMMQNSVSRMAKLIESVMDFARGRLGGGLTLGQRAFQALEPVLDQVVAELASAHPERAIETNFELGTPVYCDAPRIGQLFSNLLGNAITHGAPDAPIHVEAQVRIESFELSVANAGQPIPEKAMERLFQPFYRGEVRPSQQGLGLGLYIAAEIAKAHGGTLLVTSGHDETRFTFKMPLAQPVS
jgi:sigma-B regulation protein RsbU (phosphoserine phosphatase)